MPTFGIIFQSNFDTGWSKKLPVDYFPQNITTEVMLEYQEARKWYVIYVGTWRLDLSDLETVLFHLTVC